MVNKDPFCVFLLTVQYRMNQKIAQWSSERFYKNLLQSHYSVATRSLCDYVGIQAERLLTSAPLVFLDILKGMEECIQHSWYHVEEAASIGRYVQSLLRAGVRAADIGVITPYAAQKSILSRMFDEEHNDLEINTVDGFQGQEKHVIVLSTSCGNRFSRFVQDEQRVNVAITRAKVQFVLAGKIDFLKRSFILGNLIKYMEDNGATRLCLDVIDDDEPFN